MIYIEFIVSFLVHEDPLMSSDSKLAQKDSWTMTSFHQTKKEKALKKDPVHLVDAHYCPDRASSDALIVR
jgi:hypothetical protein